MPTPKYVTERRKFYAKFPLHSRVKSKKTGRVYVVAEHEFVRTCKLMCLNPGEYVRMSWQSALDVMEKE